MFLELSEVFVCPSCRPAQGLIVLVDAIEERRVREGHLGCPECEMRVPIREGVLRFDRVRRDAAGDDPARAGPAGGTAGGVRADVTGPDADTGGASLLAGVGREEAATRLAALLGADRAEGCLLLGQGLEPLAAPLARLAGDAEVLALASAAPDVEPPETGTNGGGGVSRAVGVDPGDLPVVTGRLAGVALLRPETDAVREAVRVLEEGGRVVLLEPDPKARGALEGKPVGVAAAEEGVVVAVREPGAATARS